MPLPSGTVLGPYRITGPLGTGGMGEVYRAHDSRLNRDVAIKTLPASMAGDSNRMARLQREAQVLASLSHPNIAPIFGLEESGGVCALVMELVEGPTLAERIAAGPIPLDEAMELAHQIANALEAAHEKGIVHRDLKPANIKLTADGKVKVLDFGLAKAFEADPASGGDPVNSPTLTLEATRAGMIMGTAGYMSPEQARGKPVDKRADIWAFGVVLFEMITGKSMFEGETVSDTLAAVLRADIDWKLLPASTPPKVRRLLQRCLERDARKRLRDIGDAWIEMDAPDEPAAAAVAAAAPRKTGLWWMGWAAAAVVAVAAGAWMLLHRPAAEQRPVVRWTYPQKLFFAFPAISHDGTRLAIAEATGNLPRLNVRMMDQLEGKVLAGGENMYTPEFSPDGQWIAAMVGQGDVKLKKIPVTGGSAITLADVGVTSGLTWGDDGSIVYSSSGVLMQISSSGGTPRKLAAPDSKQGETAYRTPHFMPGSQAVIFSIATPSVGKIAVFDLKQKSYRVLVEHGQDGRYVPTGHLLFGRGGSLMAVRFDAKRLTVTGQEAPVLEDLSTNGPLPAFSEFTVSDQGLLVYVQGASGSAGGTSLGLIGPDSQPQSITDNQLWGTGRMSPDGKHIANEITGVGGTSNSGAGDIWAVDTERRIKTRLTFGGENSFPIWTPDSRRVTYASLLNGKRGIYWVMADGSSKPELLLETVNRALPTSWSPDGKFLLYSESSGGKSTQLNVLPVAGGVAGKPYPMHESTSPEGEGQFSPDGRWVAYVSQDTGQSEVYVQAFPVAGSKERVSTQGGESPRWSHSGHELLYMVRTADGGLTSAEVQTKPQFHLGVPKLIVKGTFGTTWDVTPDPKRFLVELVGGGEPGGRTIVGVNDWFEELKRLVPVK
jgi:eukaryotic-like serine/threonine-protein kinase